MITNPLHDSPCGHRKPFGTRRIATQFQARALGSSVTLGLSSAWCVTFVRNTEEGRPFTPLQERWLWPKRRTGRKASAASRRCRRSSAVLSRAKAEKAFPMRGGLSRDVRISPATPDGKAGSRQAATVCGAEVARTDRKTEAEAIQLLTTLQARMRLAPAERSHPVSILDAGAHQCRFIIDDAAIPAICCGAPTPTGSSWCDDHLRIVFTQEGLSSHRHRLRVRTH
jgi:hypothetical protein